MSDVELFSYRTAPVRVVTIDGQPWFVLADLCRVLGLTNTSMVAQRIESDDDLSATEVIDSMGRRQETAIVSEPGMYEVIFLSRKPEARAFKRWITGEVLPAIRKTGTYSTAPQYEIPQNYAAALRLAADQTERAEAAEAQVRQLAVPASAWNELAEAAGDYAVSDAAKVLSRDPLIDIKERALFAYMSALGWVFKRDGRWKAYRTQLDTGRLAEKVGKPYLRDGVMHNGEPTVRITPKGLAELHHRLGGTGQLALIAEVSA